jgi:hypothetical protein
MSICRQQTKEKYQTGVAVRSSALETEHNYVQISLRAIHQLQKVFLEDL